MKKMTLCLTATLSIIFFSLVITSCKKNHAPQTYAYIDTFRFQYGFIPDVAGGWVPGSGLPGWFPNKGTGTSSVMGNATLCFTVYAKFKPDFSVDNISMPVNKYYAAELAAAGIKVPDEVQSIVYDNQKNSVWFKAIYRNTIQASPTRINATSELDIIGGSGKFAGAKGHVLESGYFNPVDSTEGAMGIRGTITY